MLQHTAYKLLILLWVLGVLTTDVAPGITNPLYCCTNYDAGVMLNMNMIVAKLICCTKWTVAVIMSRITYD